MSRAVTLVAVAIALAAGIGVCAEEANVRSTTSVGPCPEHNGACTGAGATSPPTALCSFVRQSTTLDDEHNSITVERETSREFTHCECHDKHHGPTCADTKKGWKLETLPGAEHKTPVSTEELEYRPVREDILSRREAVAPWRLLTPVPDCKDTAGIAAERKLLRSIEEYFGAGGSWTPEVAEWTADDARRATEELRAAGGHIVSYCGYIALYSGFAAAIIASFWFVHRRQLSGAADAGAGRLALHAVDAVNEVAGETATVVATVRAQQQPGGPLDPARAIEERPPVVDGDESENWTSVSQREGGDAAAPLPDPGQRRNEGGGHRGRLRGGAAPAGADGSPLRGARRHGGDDETAAAAGSGRRRRAGTLGPLLPASASAAGPDVDAVTELSTVPSGPVGGMSHSTHDLQEFPLNRD